MGTFTYLLGFGSHRSVGFRLVLYFAEVDESVFRPSHCYSLFFVCPANKYTYTSGLYTVGCLQRAESCCFFDHAMTAALRRDECAGAQTAEISGGEGELRRRGRGADHIAVKFT